jgi:hypothetical protein
MSEIAYIFATGITGALCGGLATYVMGKRLLSDDKILDKLDMILEEYSTNEDSLKKLYTIGGILGKGLRDGVGIDRLIPKKKGGLEGFLMDLAGSFIRDKIGGQPQENNRIINVTPEEQRRWGT